MKNKHSTKTAIAIRSIENLLDKKIVTADGKTLGHVIDIQLSQDSKYRIIALMYGYDSLLYRLHVFEPVARAFHFHQKPKKICWEAVERVDQSAIWLKEEK
jgi:sporulation protein YlmC with PRC-barrel domain